MTDLEREIAAALDAPCGCTDPRPHVWEGYGLPMRLKDCPTCLPKRIAAAIEAARSTTVLSRQRPWRSVP